MGIDAGELYNSGHQDGREEGKKELAREILDILEQGTPAKTTVYDIGKYISGELHKGINDNETE